MPKASPIEAVQAISPIPVMFLAGDNDPTIYPWHSQKLYEKSLEPKSIRVFKDNFHAEDLYLNSREEFMELCENWFINATNELSAKK
ncbi:MAG: alpha/beta hydrolase [Anaerotruncus sp.]|nr:alpha/beta hydrolase [Anaerotruncus sp.]